MKIMVLFCMARVAVAVAGLAVMAYVALGCTWAAIEETAPIAQSDDGECLRVDYPLIAPAPCSDVGIQEVADIKFNIPDTTLDGSPIIDSGGNQITAAWYDTNRQIPESEWWWVAPGGAGYTVIHTADLSGLLISATDTPPDDENSIGIVGPGEWRALSRNSDNELQVWASTGDGSLTIYRFVTASTVPTLPGV